MRNLIQYILLIGIISFSCSSNHRIDFDSDKWKNWIETESTMSLRWDMSKDLVKKHKLVDLTVPEIIDLLGEPEKKSDSEFRYYLGMARKGIDTGSLIITIENGKVTEYRFWHG